MAESNPFYIPEKLFSAKFKTSFKFIDNIADCWNDYILSLAAYEFNETKHIEPKANDIWIVEITCDHKINQDFFFQLLSDDIQVEFLEEFIIPELNWLDEVAKQIQLITVPPFMVSGKELPYSKFNIKIKAARAFGSGEHQTTKLCLAAINQLSKSHNFEKILDLGTGSGILAMGAAILNPKAHIIATDIDKVAALTAKQNIANNNLSNHIQTYTAIGYHHSVLQNKKFDLIIANILARPLINLSRATFSHLNDNGYVIISGIISSQERMVINAHFRFGLKIIKVLRLEHWSCLILQLKS